MEKKTSPPKVAGLIVFNFIALILCAAALLIVSVSPPKGVSAGVGILAFCLAVVLIMVAGFVSLMVASRAEAAEARSPCSPVAGTTVAKCPDTHARDTVTDLCVCKDETIDHNGQRYRLKCAVPTIAVDGKSYDTLSMRAQAEIVDASTLGVKDTDTGTVRAMCDAYTDERTGQPYTYLKQRFCTSI